MTDDTVLA